MNTISKLLSVLALLSGSVAANASSYTYDLNGIGTLTGFITTDCDACTLSASDITAWSITSTQGSDTIPALLAFGTVISSSADAGASIVGNYLGDLMVASPSAISFAFNSTTGSGSEIQFYDSTGFDYIQFGDQNAYLASDLGRVQTCIPGECEGFSYGGVQVIATAAAPVRAPEIDPASAVSGLTLLAGAMVVLRGRRRVLTPC
jgi:hypothetical protein